MIEERWIGNYKMIKKITKGSQGSIWEVGIMKQLKTSEESISANEESSSVSENPEILVLKRINLKTDESRKLFHREERFRNILNHDYLVEIKDIIKTDNISYIFYKPYPIDLLHYLKNSPNNRIPERVVKKWIKQIIVAMIYLNENKIMHRDLKPDNILLTSNSEDADIKICDFGLLRRYIKSAPGNHPTDSRESFLDEQKLTHVGTLEYAAPEVRKLKKYSFNCDVWSLGVITHVLIYGKYPDTKKKNNVRFPEIKDDPNFQVSEAAKEFIVLCLKDDPNARPQFSDLQGHHFLQENLMEKEQKVTNSDKNEISEISIIEDKKVEESKSKSNQLISKINIIRIPTSPEDGNCTKLRKVEIHTDNVDEDDNLQSTITTAVDKSDEIFSYSDEEKMR